MTHLLPAVRSVAAVLLVGNFLIICHELLGHYLAARLLGVPASRVAIGFGPAIARAVDRRGTRWSLSLLPLGGYVSFQGVNEQSFAARATLVRAAIIAAGPAANLVVAVAVFAVMLATSGEPAVLPFASSVAPGSPAERAGFQRGDRIRAMGDTRVAVFEDMRPFLNAGAGQTFRFQVERDGQALDLSARLDPKQDGPRTIGFLGIHSTVVTKVVLAPAAAIVRATGKTWKTIRDTITGITLAVTRGQGTENFAGVVAIAQIAGDAAGQGTATLLALIAILSANLALMNLLPIPILDGGALLFCLAEVILRRPLPARVRAAATGLGVAVLATMFMLTTVHDLDGLGVLRWLTQL